MTLACISTGNRNSGVGMRDGHGAVVAVLLGLRSPATPDCQSKEDQQMSEANIQTMNTVLSDAHPDHLGQIAVRVVANTSDLSIFAESYGDFGSADGHGCPLFIELYEGRLRLVVFNDINEEDPTIIDLEGAREDQRIETEHPLGQCGETVT